MDEVWTHLSEKIDLHARGKNGYFSHVCEILLNHSIQRYQMVTLKLLLSIKDCLGILDWTSLVIPDRHEESYRQFTSGGHSDAQLVTFILQKTHYLPKSLTIHCERFASCIRSEYWSNENLQVLVEYLTGVHELSLFFPRNGNTSVVPGFVFYVLSGRGRLQLQKLKLDGDKYHVEDAIISVGNYLRKKEVLGLQCSPCNSLREVSVGTGGPICDSTAQDLSDIIENQPSISDVRLSFQNPTVTAASPGYHHLFSTLSRVLHLSQFTDMLFEGITFIPASLQQLLHSFLAAPCYHSQTLSIFSCSLSRDMSGFVNDLSHSHPDDNNLLYKKLNLSDTDFPAAVVQWLFNQVCVCLRLNMLDLSDVTCDGTDTLPFILSLPRLEVKNLFLASSGIPEGFQWQSECFDTILGSSLLKELHLSFFGVLETENAMLLCQLISGLVKRARGVGMLETLDLACNHLGSLPDVQLLLLFEAILSLPQLEKLYLDLSDNSLDDRQLMLLYNLWQGGSGQKKLRKFGCNDSNADFLQHIAIELGSEL